MTPSIPQSPEQLADFWSRVDKKGSVPKHVSGIGNCWNWTGREKNGYGYFKNFRAARWIYEQEHGPLGELLCLHRCDNPSCVRLSHLFSGTDRDNVLDAMSKGRWNSAKGERQHCAVLNANQVLEIRSEKFKRLSDVKLGKLFGVSRSTIGHIRTRNTWRHI